jgi:hypothetical protein
VLAAHARAGPGVLARSLSLCHERRNAAEYSGVFDVDEKLMTELLKVTQSVLEKVAALPLPR